MLDGKEMLKMTQRLLGILMLISLLAGCSVDQEFVKAVDGYTGAILPEYREYVEKDSNLDAETRRIRLQTADRFRRWN